MEKYTVFSPIRSILWLLLLSLPAMQLSAAGLLTPSDGSLPPLEIRDHQVEVVIEDGYAATQVEQRFFNPHAIDLEAIYSFPVPEKGSVAEFTVWIDNQPVTGEVIEKKKARKIYEEEKAAGNDAGLTEKDGYKTFEVSVTPVQAGQETRIRLVYLQPTHIDTGIGRYVYPLEEGGVDEHKLAFWTANDKVSNRFKFDLKLKSGYPVEAVRLPNSAAARINQQDDKHWQVSIDAHNGQAAAVAKQEQEQEQEQERNTGQTMSSGPVYTLDKDIVVYWRLAENLPGSVDLLTYKPDPNGRGTFMLSLTPGDDLQPIQQGRDWIFVLDISGSMKGKYTSLVEGVSKALGKLNTSDRFRLMVFNEQAREMTSGYVNADPANVKHYIEALHTLTPNHGTNLYAGLQLGVKTLDADRTSALILVTDGVANVGETQQRAFLKLLTKQDVRLFTFIMGNSANRPLLDTLTRESGGFALSISNSDDMVGQILLAASKVGHQALHGVNLKLTGVKTGDLTPVNPGSLYRGQQLVFLGHYWGDGEVEVELNGLLSGKPKHYESQFTFPAQTDLNPELERLWAYATIEELAQQMEDFGEDADLKQAITDIGKAYGLVTDYTSMLVVRSEVFDRHGIQRSNQQRVATEQAARQQRSLKPAQSHQVDQQRPMFNKPRATLSGGSRGGGAIGPFDILLLVLLATTLLPLKRRIAGNSQK
ncbi:MAG: VIT and VWA domain-containing protein [Candidatus Thiodiazotropha sp. (ex Codakia rugifera)]|nr:VIT and VWA domain-containing protein [Candidatus Thiodiazotropha sp. (ex Codakia rugifera)]